MSSSFNLDLFADLPEPGDVFCQIAPGAVLLRGFARAQDAALMQCVDSLIKRAPLRHLLTPGGYSMSVGMSNCGALGWVSDANGYRYSAQDPLSGLEWPAMPENFAALAQAAALVAGYPYFEPDACLINQYLPTARMSLHQDRNEHHMSLPIVSVSLGLPAIFLFGGLNRSDKPQRLLLTHGDVVVWGGPSRLVFHGVAPLANGWHNMLGERRINLTFRCAGEKPTNKNPQM
jgi:alkylated DNA repair protein (DNA oxidative demethylase)